MQEFIEIGERLLESVEVLLWHLFGAILILLSSREFC